MPLVASRPTYVVRAQAVAVAVAAGGVGARVALGGPRAGVARGASGLPEVEDFGARAAAAPAAGDRGAKPAPAPPTLSLAPPGLGVVRRPARTAALPEEPEAKPAVKRARPSAGRARVVGRRLLQLFVAVLLGAGGVAAGHYAMMNGWIGPLPVHPAVQPIDPRPLGGLVGVLLAWLVTRWMSPRR